ncbi:Cof-type HAD-IIB family hydrolase [Brevibacillus daliensis]|uniref:Cof-type HAD-IIB family hydrolase n=1 Tax=Brevibacillus daliensis TaxID=2892995 RepID=UPI001E38403C|nr:Cof-type HAD-IIB family hydrolase [Brevibacillus daliensis]
MKKIVFFDVDGTLLTEQKKILDSTRTAIKRLHDQNIYVAIASGRQPSQIEDLCQELNIRSYVSINGQFVVFEGEVIYDNPIPLPILQEVTSLADKNGHTLAYVHHNSLCVNRADDTQVEEIYQELKLDMPAHLPEFYQHNPIYQGIIFCAPEQAASYSERFPHLELVRWHPYAYDILPVGCSKAVGIEQLVKRGHFALENTYAFGDGHNDLQMLATVGHGVAMGNAVAEAKKTARYVTSSCDEDGIHNGLQLVGLI